MTLAVRVRGTLLLLVCSALSLSACHRDTEPAAELHTPRQEHAAVVTGGGRVVVVGGTGDLGRALDAPFEVYDPTGRVWSEGTWPGGPRTGHALAPVGQDDVLVTGGGESGAVSSDAWLIDAVALTAQATAPMSHARARHAATVLDDGRVFVSGGVDAQGRAQASAEVWDPATGVWTEVAPMPEARAGHAAVALLDGRVLVFGGEGTDTLLAEAALWTPTTDAWSRAARMPRERVDFAALRLDDGAVLVAGGRSTQGWLQSAVLYRPSRDAWVDAGRAVEMGAGSSLVDSEGGVLWIGGAQPVSAQYDIGFDAIYRWDGDETWAQVGRVRDTRARASASTLPDGRAILVGGATTRGRALSVCEVLDGTSLVAQDDQQR